MVSLTLCLSMMDITFNTPPIELIWLEEMWLRICRIFSEGLDMCSQHRQSSRSSRKSKTESVSWVPLKYKMSDSLMRGRWRIPICCLIIQSLNWHMKNKEPLKSYFHQKSMVWKCNVRQSHLLISTSRNSCKYITKSRYRFKKNTLLWNRYIRG